MGGPDAKLWSSITSRSSLSTVQTRRPVYTCGRRSQQCERICTLLARGETLLEATDWGSAPLKKLSFFGTASMEGTRVESWSCRSSSTTLRCRRMKLSVVMPVYNERATLREVVERVLSVPLEIELICVDDGSTDGSREILAQLQAHSPQIRTVLQPHNMGKGAALHRGIQEATATSSLSRMPISSTIQRSIRCCWSRSSKVEPTWSTVRAFFRPPASRALLLAFGGQLDSYSALECADQHQPQRHGDLLQSLPARNYPIDSSGRKAFRIRARDHGEDRQAKLSIYEVGISYRGRTYEEGKKINWKDGVRALWCLVKYCITEPAVARPAATLPEPAALAAGATSNKLPSAD